MKALVTGASRGVGAAITRRLAAGGHEVLAVYRRAHDLAAQVREAHPEAVALLAADLGDPAGVRSVVDALGAPLEIVVLNAGVATRAPFETLELDGVDPLSQQIELDLLAPLRLLRALLHAQRVAEGARIVFLGSNLARHGLAGKVAYAAAKAGIEGAVRGLAKELGPRGIRVNAVAPGLLRTDMTADTGEAGFAAYAREVPLGRVGTPDDVARVVEFFVGENADYVSGQVLDVDGAWGA